MTIATAAVVGLGQTAASAGSLDTVPWGKWCEQSLAPTLIGASLQLLLLI